VYSKQRSDVVMAH